MTASRVALTSAEGVRFDVASGALCLDFVYTGGAGERARWESLHEVADLERWLRSSRLADAARMPAMITLTDADFVQAYELREVLWSCANDLADGREVGTGHAEALNRWAREPDLVVELIDGRAEWLAPVTGPQVLSALARDAIKLISGPWSTRVRRCAAPDCALLFVDTSRPGRRRWCAMTRCGNRNKSRTRRAHTPRTHSAGSAGLSGPDNPAEPAECELHRGGGG